MSTRVAIASFAAAAVLVGCGTIDVGREPAERGVVGSTAERAADIDSVLMIGDSITKGSLPYLDDRFASLGLEHTIVAENGKRMAVERQENPSGASLASFFAENGDGDHSDEVWVVALGTNDIGQYASPDEIAAAVNEVLDEVPEDAALVWVDTYIGGSPEQTDALNSIMRRRVERRGDSVIAPWTAFATGDGVLTGDGVHPTSGGADVFAFVVTDTVRAFLDR